MPTYIDAHTHGMHAERDEHGKLTPPVVPLWKPGDPTDGIERARSQGVTRTILLDPPEAAFPLAENLPDFCVPVPQVYADESSPDEINALFDRGARGIKFIAPLRSYGDNRYLPLYETIRDLGGVAVFHTGFLAHGMFDPGMLLGRPDYIDITHMRPAALDRICRALPDLKIQMAHFGNPWWEEAWTVLKSNRNIYTEFSGGTAAKKPMALWRDLFKPNGELHTDSVSRLCYATDGAPLSPEDNSTTRFIDFHDRLYAELGVPDELQQRINYQNAEQLYGITA